MVLVDTCGWIEWLSESKLSTKFQKYLTNPSELIIPTIIQYELYKWVCRERDEVLALNVIGLTERGQILPIDSNIALTAADIAMQHKLTFADSIIYACAQIHKVELITCDKHFKNLSNVIYFEKS